MAGMLSGHIPVTLVKTLQSAMAATGSRPLARMRISRSTLEGPNFS